jgi:outer membrane protein assembly factor BamB
MKTYPLILFIIFAFISASIRVNAQSQDPCSWPQWRGPLFTGAALKGNPPVEFSETKNLKWKREIPGKGHSTPIICGDRIIVTSAVATTEKPVADAVGAAKPADRMPVNRTEFIHEFKVYLIDRKDGHIIWDKTVIRKRPEEGTHEFGSWASNSPVTDGEHIFADFGSRGLYCLDFKGNIIWQKNFGQMDIKMNFGEGESPCLYKDRLFLQWDHEGESFMASMDKKTGHEIWRVKRDEKTSWATPLVVEVNGKPQVITVATSLVRSYDAGTGELIWSSSGMTANAIPCPVYADGILYVMSGFRGNALQAIDPTKAKGDITGTDAIMWTYNQDTPYTPSPLLMDGRLYFLRANNGILTCLDAKTGKVIYSNQKTEGINQLFSSLTGVGDRIYMVSKNRALVIKAGDTFQILSSNPLDDDFIASPVIVDDELFLRGYHYLYCFSEK